MPHRPVLARRPKDVWRPRASCATCWSERRWITVIEFLVVSWEPSFSRTDDKENS
jgi:hypothetical protein